MHKTQQERILSLLQKYSKVPVTKILKLRPYIANHTARISELRHKGHVIEDTVTTVKTRRGFENHSVYEYKGQVPFDNRLI